MTAVTSRSIIKELKAVFARVGLPDIVTDNGPQFASARFAVFARTWGFDHVTLSPTYVQSNGKSEMPCRQSSVSSRNVKIRGNSSTLPFLTGATCQAEKLAQDTEAETRALLGRKQRQQYYFNRGARPLEVIAPGETVAATKLLPGIMFSLR